MDNENIKKIISETLSSEEFMNGIIEQIQSQIKKEQEKVNPKKIKINKIKKGPNIKNTDIKKTHDMEENITPHTKFMNMFQNCTTNLDNITFSGPYNIKNNLNSNNINQNKMSPVIPDLNLTPLYFMPKVTTIDDERICDIYTKFPEKISDINHADMGNNIKRLNSLLVANIENWHNWYLETSFNRDIPNTGISEKMDIYFCQFSDDILKLIDNNKDYIKSYIYVDFDVMLKKISIYMVNYSDVTHKVYDFFRWVFYPSPEASDEKIKLFYFNLYNYFSNGNNLQKTFEDYMDHLVDEYIIIYKDKIINSIQKEVSETLEVVENLRDLLLSTIDEELNVLKEYFNSYSEEINISSDDNDDTLKIEINSPKDKRDKIKLLLHLAMDEFIKVNYNQGDILFNIDGKIISMENPYWK